MSEYLVDIKLLSANESGVNITNKDVEQKIDKKLYKSYYFKICIKMSVRDFYGNIHFASEQVQFGSGQAQSRSGKAQSRNEQTQSSSTSLAAQMLINQNKLREENKPIDKEKQKEEVEKALESIRRFNQINEIKELYDKQVKNSKQREVDMYESMQKTEAKFFPDRESSKDRESS